MNQRMNQCMHDCDIVMVDIIPPTPSYLGCCPGRACELAYTFECLKGLGVTTIVNLLSPEDYGKYNLQFSEYEAQRIQGGIPCLVSFPIPDYGIPVDLPSFVKVIVSTVQAIRSGSRIFIHCGAGIGRTGLFVAALRMMAARINDEEAYHWVRTIRQHAVENDAQRAFLHDFYQMICT